MTVFTFKEYAKMKNISYEAVRKQVARYKKELEGHIIQDGRQQFLDEEAVAFLDERRMKNPVVLVQQDKDAELERLRKEKEDLLIRLTALNDWKAEKAIEIARAEQQLLLIEAKDEEIKQLQSEKEAVEKDKSVLEGFIQDAKTEIATLTEEKEAEIARAKKAEEELEKERAEETRIKAEKEALERANEEARAKLAEAEKMAENARNELKTYIDLPWYKKIFR